MALPKWLATVNKHVFNPREVRKGKRPILVHNGRSSGKVYETPLDAIPTETGYVLPVRYGLDSDWVQNVVGQGSAKLRIEGGEHEMRSGGTVDQTEALRQLPSGYEPSKDFMTTDDYLLLERV